MRIYFMSKMSVFDCYLISQVAKHVELTGVIRLVAAGKRPIGKQKGTVKRIARIAGNVLSLPYRRYWDHLNMSAAYRAFSREGEGTLPEKIIDLPSSGINSSESKAVIESLEPDVIVVSGAPLLRPKIFNIPRIACLNVHRGITPHYRGEHASFWALRCEDYSNIGVTVHHVDSGVDTGRAVAKGYPSLEAEDTEFSINVKNTQLSVTLLVEVLSHIRRTGKAPPLKKETCGSISHGKGKLIRSTDRGLHHDAAYFYRRNLLKHRPSPSPERCVYFY